MQTPEPSNGPHRPSLKPPILKPQNESNRSLRPGGFIAPGFPLDGSLVPYHWLFLLVGVLLVDVM